MYLVLEHDEALVKVARPVALAVHPPHQPRAVGPLVAVLVEVHLAVLTLLVKQRGRLPHDISYLLVGDHGPDLFPELYKNMG